MLKPVQHDRWEKRYDFFTTPYEHHMINKNKDNSCGLLSAFYPNQPILYATGAQKPYGGHAPTTKNLLKPHIGILKGF